MRVQMYTFRLPSMAAFVGYSIFRLHERLRSLNSVIGRCTLVKSLPSQQNVSDLGIWTRDPQVRTWETAFFSLSYDPCFRSPPEDELSASRQPPEPAVGLSLRHDMILRSTLVLPPTSPTCPHPHVHRVSSVCSFCRVHLGSGLQRQHPVRWIASRLPTRSSLPFHFRPSHRMPRHPELWFCTHVQRRPPIDNDAPRSLPDSAATVPEHLSSQPILPVSSSVCNHFWCTSPLTYRVQSSRVVINYPARFPRKESTQ